MRLGVWQRLMVYCSVGAVAASGLAWFILHDFSGDEISPALHALLVIHGVASFATLIAFGSLLPVHVRSGWLRGRNRATGTAMIAIFAVLIVTAVILYYGSEESHLWGRWLHIAVGLLCFGAVPLHVVRGERSAVAGRGAQAGNRYQAGSVAGVGRS